MIARLISRFISRLIPLIALFALFSASVLAIEPDERLADPALEARARALSVEIRCLVCQNQSIDDSNAQLARDLRVIVRERLVAGDEDQAVLDYLVARYGDFVLLRPPVNSNTYALWAAPVGALVLGLIGVLVFLRSRRRDAEIPDPLSDDERARLDRLLKDTDGGAS